MNQIEITELLKNEYINRPLEDERFSFDEWLKVTQMRVQQEVRESATYNRDWLNVDTPIILNDRVSFVEDGPPVAAADLSGRTRIDDRTIGR